MLSIIMPVYNAEKYLSEAIESILSQTYKDFEFIIINDGSTDNSQNIIDEYVKKDRRINCIKKENGGVAETLNRGLNEAVGEYIVRMDADDISYPNRLERLNDFMNEHPEIDVCGSFALTNGSKLRARPIEDRMLKFYAIFSPPFIHPTVCFRKSFIEENNIRYNLVAAEDYDLWTRLLDIATFANIPEPLLMYRVHGNNVTIKNVDKLINDDFRIKCRLFQENGIANIPKHHYEDPNLNLDDAHVFLDIIAFFAKKYNIQVPLPRDVEKKIVGLTIKAERGICGAYRLYADKMKSMNGNISPEMLCYFIARFFKEKLNL